MRINDLIFEEIQDQSVDPMANEYFTESILPQIADKEDDISDLSFYFLPERSLLYHALLKYFHGKENLLKRIRSAVEDDDGIYFASGFGYDWISADLLGGEPDGQAKNDFLKWINKKD